MREQSANLQYAWNGVQIGGSQAEGYAQELDQIAISNIEPDVAALLEVLRSKAGHVAPADSSFERDFGQAVKHWQRVAALAHAIKTTAQRYNSSSRTARAINAFQNQLTATQQLWNDAVTSLWSAAHRVPAPTVHADCSPRDKAACK